MTKATRSAFIGSTGSDRHRIDPEHPFVQYQSWLSENGGILGCPVDCQYCFFKVDALTPVRPVIGVSPKELVDCLGAQPTYHPRMPVHFGSKTDAFSTAATIAYYSEVLGHYGESSYPNPLIFITKKGIPEAFMDIATGIKQPVLFYLSFSGLAGTNIEPLVSMNVQKRNFVLLKERGLRVIHYWRPFLPQNSAPEHMTGMLDFVSQYACCSVVHGLRLNEGIRSLMVQFWPELAQYTGDMLTAGEFWPIGVRNTLFKLVREQYPSYPVFAGNTTCSTSLSLGLPDSYGHFGKNSCLESQCPQRDLCQAQYRQPSKQELDAAIAAMSIDATHVHMHAQGIHIDARVPSEKITYLRHVLRFPVVTGGIDYSGGYTWANIGDTEQVIEIPWSQT